MFGSRQTGQNKRHWLSSIHCTEAESTRGETRGDFRKSGDTYFSECRAAWGVSCCAGILFRACEACRVVVYRRRSARPGSTARANPPSVSA